MREAERHGLAGLCAATLAGFSFCSSHALFLSRCSTRWPRVLVGIGECEQASNTEFKAVFQTVKSLSRCCYQGSPSVRVTVRTGRAPYGSTCAGTYGWRAGQRGEEAET